MTFSPGPKPKEFVYSKQPKGPAPYPTDAAPKPGRQTVGSVQALSALLNDPFCFIPPTDFSSVASSLQSVTRVCGKLTSIVNAATTSVLLTNAIRQNTPGFALMVGIGVVSQTAQQAGVDPKNVVGSAIARANQIVSSPMRFLENAFRARSYAQASFTGSGIADVFKALGSVTGLLRSCKTLTDVLSGGVSSRFGPNADNTRAGQRIRASGISVNASHIRAGLAAVSYAMRQLGTLWDPNDGETIGTPQGLVLSLQKQGIADLVGLPELLLAEGIFIDDEEDVRGTSKYAHLNALKKITGKELKIIIERTNCLPERPNNIQTAADLCVGEYLISEQALDNIPYADLTNFGKQIASMGIKNRATWEEIADVLDSLELPDVGLIDNPNFTSDMVNLSAKLGTGSGLFGDATMFDFLGTEIGRAHV